MVLRWLIVVAWLLPCSAWAQNHLEQAKQLTAEMKYLQALWAVDQVLKSPKSGPDELTTAFRLKGLCMAALGKTKKAVANFKIMLALDPGYRLGKGVSPKLRPSFESALKAASKQKPLALLHKVPKTLDLKRGATLGVTLAANPYKLVRTVRMWYRVDRGKKHTKKKRVKKAGSFAFALPKNLKASKIEYAFEAVNRHGGVLARAGSEAQPFSYPPEKDEPLLAAVVPGEPGGEDPGDAAATDGEGTPGEETATDVALDTAPSTTEPVTPGVTDDLGAAGEAEKEDEEDAGTPWYKTWWFWTGVGVVVAGTATGIAVAATSGGGSDAIRYDVYLK